MTELTRKSLTGRETMIISLMSVLAGLLMLLFFGLIPTKIVEKALPSPQQRIVVTHTVKTTITPTPLSPIASVRNVTHSESSTIFPTADVVTKTVTRSLQGTPKTSWATKSANSTFTAFKTLQGPVVTRTVFRTQPRPTLTLGVPRKTVTIRPPAIRITSTVMIKVCDLPICHTQANK